LIDLNDCVFEAGACKERFHYLHESPDNEVEPLNLDVLPEAGLEIKVAADVAGSFPEEIEPGHAWKVALPVVILGCIRLRSSS
jgi:hypothetical protein